MKRIKRRFIIRLITALVTFGVGVGAAAWWVNQRATPAEEPGAHACCGARFESELPRGLEAADFYFRAGTFLPDELREKAFAKWYAGSLSALEEPSLYSLADTNIETYRFVWLRSFHPAVSIRLWRCDRGSYCMSAKQLDSLDEYVDGEFIPSARMSVSYTRPLTSDEWNNFTSLTGKTLFWSMPTVDGLPLANDGAQWVLEGVKDNRHHLVDRQSPESGAYRDACVYLIRLSGLPVDETKDELY